MIEKMRQTGLMILAMLALIAVAGLAAACGDDETTTTAPANTDTTMAATTTTVDDPAASTATSTLVPSAKSRDEYRAEIPELEKALETDPNDLYSLEALAVAHLQLEEYEQAEAAFLRILAIQEDAFTRNNLGNVYRDWGKTDEAKAAYRQAIEEDPTLKYPYVNLAGVLKKEGDIEGAAEVLREGLKYVAQEGQSAIEAAQEALTTTTT